MQPKADIAARQAAISGKRAGRSVAQPAPGEGLRLAQPAEGLCVGRAVADPDGLHDDGPVGREPLADLVTDHEAQGVAGRVAGHAAASRAGDRCQGVIALAAGGVITIMIARNGRGPWLPYV